MQDIARAWYLRPQDLPADVHRGGLEATVGYKPERDSGTFSYAAHAVTVAVDPELGDVEILDYVIVEDGGKLVNPMVVDGQIYGGLAQGIGTALYEEMPFDNNGQPLATTFADYLLPGPTEVPEPRLDHMRDAGALYGIRGQGHRRRRRHRPAGGDRQCRQRRAQGIGRRALVFPDHAAPRSRIHRRCQIAARERCRAGRSAIVKPVNFAYERPRHLDDAIGLLADQSAHTKVLAGGQSLGPC